MDSKMVPIQLFAYPTCYDCDGGGIIRKSEFERVICNCVEVVTGKPKEDDDDGQ
jgi:hypothetical protein